MWRKLFRFCTFVSAPALIYTPFVWLLPRPNLVSYPANNPIEDRVVVSDLENWKGRLAAVFDGHGGWQVSDYLSKNITLNAEKQLKSLSKPSKENLKQIMESLFDSLEQEIYDNARKPYSMGFANVSFVGACGLVAFVTDEFYVLGNAGDCQAVLVTRDGEKVQGINLCKIHSSNLPEEQQRLAAKFPGEKDIVVCKHPKACYVKGRLMPTHSFGDLYLKHSEFNNPERYPPTFGFRKPSIPNFTGPYISHKPDIQIRDIQAHDQFLILASDGLWDEMTEQEAAEVISHCTSTEEATQLLLETALRKAAESSRMSMSDIKNLKLGDRRSYHDDISIVVIPLH